MQDYYFVSLSVRGVLQKSVAAELDKIEQEFKRLGSMGWEFVNEIKVENVTDGSYWRFAVFKFQK
jgi:hypothetical protein